MPNFITFDNLINPLLSSGPGTPHPKWEEMDNRWAVIDDILGGTEHMRLRGRIYIPQEPKEETSAYMSRVNRTFLFPGLKSAIKRQLSKPFSKSVVINPKPNLTGRFDANDWVKDVTGFGVDLTGYLRMWHQSALKYGMSHTLVDMDPIPSVSISAIESRKQIPHLVHISPRDLISWSYDDIGLSEIRFIEHVTIPDPDNVWGKILQDRIKVITRTE